MVIGSCAMSQVRACGEVLEPYRLQRCHDDLDRATGFLDQAGSRLT